MMARPINAAISPYSTAVAPPSSATKRRHAPTRVGRKFDWAMVLSFNSEMQSQKRCKMRYQRHVGGRHLIVPQTVWSDPGKFLFLPGAHDPLPSPAYVQWHEKMKIQVSMAREGEGRDTGFVDRYPQFFLELANECLFRPFARFHLTTRELP